MFNVVSDLWPNGEPHCFLDTSVGLLKTQIQPCLPILCIISIHTTHCAKIVIFEAFYDIYRHLENELL